MKLKKTVNTEELVADIFESSETEAQLSRTLTSFDLLGGRTAARKSRRNRKLVSYGIVALFASFYGFKAVSSIVDTNAAESRIAEVTERDASVQAAIESELETGATEGQMLEDLSTTRQLVSAAFAHDAAAASVLTSIGEVSTENGNITSVQLLAGAQSESSFLLPSIQLTATVKSQTAVSFWLQDLSETFPNVNWGFPSWGNPDASGFISVTISGEFTSTSSTRFLAISPSLMPPAAQTTSEGAEQ